MTDWGDLDARARGLTTHLLGRRRLAELAGCTSLGELAKELEALGYQLAPAADVVTAEALEVGVRRIAARRVRTIARWAGSRADVLSVLFGDEDRRSVRALLRGALQGAPAAQRLAGLIPTPSLPEGALEELAVNERIGDVVTLLALWEHPYGPPLLAEARREQPDPLVLELTLNRVFARRAVDAARHAGASLRQYVALVIDLENARTALALDASTADVDLEAAFLPGGERVTLELLSRPHDLPAAFGGTPYVEALERGAANDAALEAQLLARMIADVVSAARLDPLGPFPLIGYWLRLRAECVDLQRIIWGIVSLAPPAVVEPELVTRS